MKKEKYYSINIPLNKNVSFNTLFAIEQNLLKQGILFDTGSDLSSRDWELDWSLKGAKPSEVMKVLKDRKIKFTKHEVAIEPIDEWVADK